ncbi:hypothetical protein FLK61_26585 [Paenalkalicoccus suaedae]|uniref:Uncharacterized protein n=1 Tax=Paenalkalicoccus suaedae TaxID=2592382 RepID=A0A859FDM0_9BACI|nr:hypothetical protein [Paenalkalicoccus suaedae]QKS70326.1 hypothetical protein FLK61_26585 [Paenalkalicoccus suaedae]
MKKRVATFFIGATMLLSACGESGMELSGGSSIIGESDLRFGDNTISDQDTIERYLGIVDRDNETLEDDEYARRIADHIIFVNDHDDASFFNGVSIFANDDTMVYRPFASMGPFYSINEEDVDFILNIMAELQGTNSN